ncbi:MAG: hypothetical protein IPJ97_07195 [Proteobacteria bacterium]|nr:hypothetical protein [Pseudomonadota bacterium]
MGRQQGRLAQRRRIRASRKGRACLLEPARRVCVGAEVDLVETHDRGLAERGRIRIEIGLQVGVGCRVLRDGFLEQHVELLADAAFDHGIVTVQAKRNALAVQDLVAHVGIDQSVQLGRARRPAPGALELRGQQVDVGLAHDDAAFAVVVRRHAPVVSEQGQPEQQEVQQRLT